ncbi:MAG: VanZ family protein [Sulfuricurvum sp.]
MIFFFRFSFFIALIAISILAFLPNYSALPSIVSISDLINHAVAFTVLSVLYSLSYPYYSLKQTLLTLIGYGIFIEIVQAFLSTRYASIEDVLADSVGLIIGLVLLKIFRPTMGQSF